MRRNQGAGPTLAGLVALATWVAGCGDPLGIEVIALDMVGTPIVSPAEPGDFRITATNSGGSRIVWGMGSSSCQFGLLVSIAGGERRSVDFRACTDDLVEQGLDPGESRSEIITWGGEVPTPSGPELLPAGRYRIIAVAGTAGESRSLAVTVQHP